MSLYMNFAPRCWPLPWIFLADWRKFACCSLTLFVHQCCGCTETLYFITGIGDDLARHIMIAKYLDVSLSAVQWFFLSRNTIHTRTHARTHYTLLTRACILPRSKFEPKMMILSHHGKDGSDRDLFCSMCRCIFVGRKGLCFSVYSLWLSAV